MKRLIAACVLTAIIAAVYFAGNIYINSVMKKSNVLIDQCIDSYDSATNPEEKAKELKSYWSENEGFLSVFAHHESIDEIEQAIDSLVVYSITENSEIFYEYSGTVKTLLHQLSEDNSLNMHSVF